MAFKRSSVRSRSAPPTFQKHHFSRKIRKRFPSPSSAFQTQSQVKQKVVTMQELFASSLAQTDALTKLLIEKGIITKDEFMQKLSDERAVYQAMMKKVK